MKHMKFKNVLFRSTSWLMTHAAWVTMTLSPVAQGQEAERQTVKDIKQNIQQLGLNKKTTVKEFWDKVKADLPGYAYYEIEQLVKKDPNAMMPQYQVSSSKAGYGTEVPVLTFTESGVLHTIQIFGEKEKFIKFDNTIVSENDSRQIEVLFQKLIDGDSKLNKRYQDALKAEKQKTNGSAKRPANAVNDAAVANFAGMNKATWKQMTIEQRVSFFIQMRMMYLDARKVIDGQPAAKGQKTSSFKQLEGIFAALFPKAEAQTSTVDKKTGKGPGTRVTLTSGKRQGSVTIPFNAQSCLVAGYVGKYVKGTKNGVSLAGCSIDVAIATYANNKELNYVTTANKTCQSTGGSNSYACNPIIYGYPKGHPICVNKMDEPFQKATHFEGPCDTKSRLSSSVKIVDTSKKDYSKIIPLAAQIAAIKEDQARENFQMSKDFISGVLQSKTDNPELFALFGKGEWSEALEMEIKRISSQFDNEINQAIKICERDIKQTHEINQRGACDQLHRRRLFVDQLLKDLKCPSGQDKIDGKCAEKTAAEVTCSAGGEECTPTTTPPPPAEVACPNGSKPGSMPGNCICKNAKGEESEFSAELTKGKLPGDCINLPDLDAGISCDQYPPLEVGADLNEDCTCKNKAGSGGNIPKEDQPNIFRKIFNTKANKKFKTTKTEERAHSCKFGPNWWVVGGVGAALAGAAYLIFKKKTKTVTVTNTIVKNTTTVIDNPICKTPPKSYWTGTSCECPPCGVYYFANGQSRVIVPNPLVCTCAAPPSEGGHGENPNDDGGGVPGGTGK